jgi:hypothetical protein
VALYWVSVDALALVANTAKTVLEVKTASTNRARIVEWWVEFDGTTPTNVPVKIEVGRFSAAVTTATSAAEQYDPADGAPTATGSHSTTTEGAGTASDIMLHRVNPTTGLYVQYPLGRELVIPVSSFWRMRCTAANGVNVTAGVTWEE